MGLNMDWSAFFQMILILWGTLGVLAFLQGNAQAGWVSWLGDQLAETRYVVGGLLDFFAYLILGLLAFGWVVLSGPLALRMVVDEEENDVFEIPLLFYYGFIAVWFEWYHRQPICEDLDYEW